MPRPNTRGVLRNHILDMEIGDYFPMQIVEGSVYGSDSNTDITSVDWEWGKNCHKAELSIVSGADLAISDGIFYMIKVDDGLLVSDRIVKTNVSHQTLRNSAENNYIAGKYMVIDGVEGVMRSLTGGVGYMSAKGIATSTLPNENTGGYPYDNEYDKYIVRSNLNGTAEPNDDAVWHNLIWKTITYNLRFDSGGECVIRGGDNSGIALSFTGTTVNPPSGGFRPVFDYGYKNR